MALDPNFYRGPWLGNWRARRRKKAETEAYINGIIRNFEARNQRLPVIEPDAALSTEQHERLSALGRAWGGDQPLPSPLEIVQRYSETE